MVCNSHYFYFNSMCQNEYIKIISDLEEKLLQLKSETDHILLFSERAALKCKSALLQMRDAVIQNGFSNQNDEIDFFKNIKPQVYSKLLYHVKVFNIESKRPNASNKSQRKYLTTEQDKIQTFFNDHLEFCQYYRCNTTNLDDRFFVRGRADIRLCLDNLFFLNDDQFSTSHDYSVAAIKAYDMLFVYLKNEIEKLDSRNGNSLASELDDDIIESRLFWTESKAALIELIYALHSFGAINKGAFEIKELAGLFEKIFHIELGDLYRTYIEIRLRKKEKAKFIDSLKEALLRKMDEADQ